MSAHRTHAPRRRARRLTRRLVLVPAMVASLVLGVLGPTTPARAQRIDPEFFGMHDQWIRDGWLPTVEIGSIRLWDTGTSWREVEQRPGRFTWTPVDRAVETALGAGLRPMLVLGQTPRFHSTRPRTPGFYGAGATAMPDLGAWRRYVARAVRRYGDLVDYQIWNEPNVTGFWTGSVKQMARLTATGSAIIRREVPEATVVAPSFVLRLKYQQRWYRHYWATRVAGRGMASYVDVVSTNLYPADGEGPEGSLTPLRFATTTLPPAARALPMWNTEINFAYPRPLSQKRQAAFVSRTLLLNAASRVRRVYWYAWAWELGSVKLADVEDRTTLTRAGEAWQETHGWLLDTEMGSCRQRRRGPSARVYTCTAVAGPAEVRRFYWKPSGAPVTVETHPTTYSTTTLDGEVALKLGSVPLEVGSTPVMVTSAQ